MENIGNFSPQAARKFADKYKDASSEKRLAQSFWRDFFHSVVGITDLLATGIEFEFPVRSSEGRVNFIDCFWPGVVLIEHKSAGKDLDVAEKQARDYVAGLMPIQRPPVIIVSDFKRIRILELIAGTSIEFQVQELPDHLARFEDIIGKRLEQVSKLETTADQEAVELMARLFVEFEKAGYGGHEVSVFLVRILFLNFGDDTRMWLRKGTGLFSEFVKATSPDGMGVGGRIQELFQTLDTPVEQRPGTLNPSMKDFPYVNGGLFREQLPIFAFTPAMREALIVASEYDWSKISPAIFGAMFQTVKSKEDRRSLGEHYTSEENILKVIRPLFLDEYLERLTAAWESPNLLKKLKLELSLNHYLDPACGSGNFLVVAYKRLREIELKIDARLQEIEGTQGQVFLDGQLGLSVHLGQFAGIEINEWSSQIAVVAMFLADHQANLAMEEVTGRSPNRFPLKESAKIRHANSLEIEWSEVVPITNTTFIMGNPPFLGSNWQSPEQRADQANLWAGRKGFASLDFVANWYLKAARALKGTSGKAAFVATNSITQGEQPAALWSAMYELGFDIDFAHRTFAWSNEASGQASVHCVIIGFSANQKSKKLPLWTYENPNAAPNLVMATQINAYLIDAAKVLIQPRSKPLDSATPTMRYGNMPNEFGFLANIYEEDLENLRIAKDEIALKYIRPLIGATEMLNDKARYCLWLVHAEPGEMDKSPFIRERVAGVKKLRSESARKATVELAKTPYLFQEVREQTGNYLAVPIVSSGNREYIPMKMFSPNVIPTNALLTIPQIDGSTFAILQSKFFSIWMQAVAGRLKNDYRISAEITYNNFPFPTLTPEQKAELEATGLAIVEARNAFPNSSLSELYKVTTMPKKLVDAHSANDKAVALAFGLKGSARSDEILGVIFDRYAALAES